MLHSQHLPVPEVLSRLQMLEGARLRAQAPAVSQRFPWIRKSEAYRIFGLYFEENMAYAVGGAAELLEGITMLDPVRIVRGASFIWGAPVAAPFSSIGNHVGSAIVAIPCTLTYLAGQVVLVGGFTLYITQTALQASPASEAPEAAP